ncbi:MAG: RNA polymerase sigma factor [Saprospiraceae bacterium]
MSLIDKTLVATFLASRDEWVFKGIYNRHHNALWRVAMYLTNDKVVAADLVQETWLKATKGLEMFQWKSSLRTWMIKILFNTHKEFIRQKKYVEDIDQVKNINDLKVDRIQMQLDHRSILNQMPEGYKSILLLHDVEGYTHEEIARIMDIAEGTSKSQLHHARKKYRSLLDI